MKDSPQFSKAIININHRHVIPVKYGSQFELVAVRSKNTIGFWPCAASSKDYIALTGDNRSVRILSRAINRTVLQYPFPGIVIHLGVHEHHLYILGAAEMCQKLVIINLDDLAALPREIDLPIYSGTSTFQEDLFCFGKTHLICLEIVDNKTTLFTASYENLLSSPSVKWLTHTVMQCLRLFEHGSDFVCIAEEDLKTFSIQKVQISDESITFYPLVTEISEFKYEDFEKNCFYYTQGRLFIHYKDNFKTIMGTYDIETENVKFYELGEGVAVASFFPLPKFIATTSLKVHFLTYMSFGTKVGNYTLDYST